ncbi:MAG: ATP-binding protein [Chloroflexota bacterium]
MNKRKMVEILIPSQLGYEKVVIAALVALAKKIGLSQEKTDDLKTAVGEAVANAIEHGNQSDVARNVYVTAQIQPKALVLQIRDSGQKPLPTFPAVRRDRPDHRGWGMVLIQNLVDDVKSIAKPGQNELYMTFHRAA